MARLKIGAIADETPVKLSVMLSAAVHRDLAAYADALSKENGQAIEPAQLVGPMLRRFMATDRAFSKWRRAERLAELGMSTKRHESEAGAGDSKEQ